ncbi:MAG: type VI secretion system-associated FHA domain protein TagH [Sulfuricurvum sp.]|nr:type VI secretion system-associated FHA domain protein TagH [Sulfuricurvum sp.]
MQLILDIVKSGKSRPTYKYMKFNQCEGIIGRSSDANYQLSDFDNYISSKHIYIEYKYEQYYIRDESTNGTYLKHPYKKLPKGIAHLISSSDVYIIGDHELQARFSDDDYIDDYIVGNFSNEPEPLEAIKELIPDDDFLYEDVRDSLNNTAEESIKKDVLDILDNTKIASDLLETKENIYLESTEVEPNIYNQHINVPTFAAKELHKNKYTQTVDKQLTDSIRILEDKLGLEIIALEKTERDLLMNELADVLINSLDGLRNSLYIKDKTKQDLDVETDQINQNKNDPIKLGHSALQLLQDERMEGRAGFINLSVAVTRSFSQIDTHTIALHGASKNLMATALSKFAPKSLEHQFDSAGALRGAMPRSCLMWKAYTQMFEKLNDSPDSGVDILSPYFVKEYEKLAFSIALASSDK